MLRWPEPDQPLCQRVGLGLIHVLAWLLSGAGVLLLSARLLTPFSLPWWMFVGALEVGNLYFHGRWTYYLLIQGGTVEVAKKLGYLAPENEIAYHALLGQQITFYCALSWLLAAVSVGLGGLWLAPLVALSPVLVIVALEFLWLAVALEWIMVILCFFGLWADTGLSWVGHVLLWCVALLPSSWALVVLTWPT